MCQWHTLYSNDPAPTKAVGLLLKRDEVVGFVCFHDVGFRAYLSEIVVSESMRRVGIGTKLLYTGERLLLDRGCRLVVADVYPPAEGFY